MSIHCNDLVICVQLTWRIPIHILSFRMHNIICTMSRALHLHQPGHILSQFVCRKVQALVTYNVLFHVLFGCLTGAHVRRFEYQFNDKMCNEWHPSMSQKFIFQLHACHTTAHNSLLNAHI